MATVRKGNVTQSHARSRSGPTVGERRATSGTAIRINCSAFEGQYIRIRAVTEDIYFAFCPTNSNSLAKSATTEFTDFVADIITAGTSEEFTVPVGSPYLTVESVSGSAGAVIVLSA